MSQHKTKQLPAPFISIHFTLHPLLTFTAASNPYCDSQLESSTDCCHALEDRIININYTTQPHITMRLAIKFIQFPIHSLFHWVYRVVECVLPRQIYGTCRTGSSFIPHRVTPLRTAAICGRTICLCLHFIHHIIHSFESRCRVRTSFRVGHDLSSTCDSHSARCRWVL